MGRAFPSIPYRGDILMYLSIGVGIGLLIGIAFSGAFLGKGSRNSVPVRDVESRILSNMASVEINGPDSVDKYSVVQLLNMYYAMLYLYPDLRYDTRAILAAIALDVSLRGLVFAPASVVSVVDDSPCGELVKAAIFAKLRQRDAVRDRLARSSRCDATGSEAVRKYCEAFLGS